MPRRIALIALLLGLAACGAPPRDETILPTRVQIVLDEPTPTAEPTEAPDRTLQFWEASDGLLSPSVPDTWQFSAESGDEISVRVVGLAVELTLTTAAGGIIDQGEEIRAVVPEDGDYLVQVAALDDGGAYQIGLGYIDRPNPYLSGAPTAITEVVGVPTPTPVYNELGSFISQIEHEQTLGGTITGNLTPHIYTFEGTAGEYVTVEMRAVSAELYPRLTLFDPGVQAIATDSESGGERFAALRNIRLGRDGLHSIQVIGSVPGGYSVRLIRQAQFIAVTPNAPVIEPTAPVPTYSGIPTPMIVSGGVRLADHAPVISTLDTPTAVGIHAIELREGDVVTVGAGPVGGSGLRLQIEILNPDGVIVARATSDESADDDAIISPLLADLGGVYQVFVTSTNAITGQYVVSYGIGSSWLETSQSSPPPDEQVSGALRRRGARDIWTATLQRGDIITIGVTPNDAVVFDPIVDIVPASQPDRVLAVDDNSGGNRAALIQRVEIPQDDVYLIRVRGSGGTSTGAYTLIWRYVNIAPTPTAPPATYPILARADTVADGQYAFYPFYGYFGQQVMVYVEATDGRFDPVAALIAPDGTVLIEVDDVGDSLNPRFTFTLPAAGTYQVRVNGYLAGGAFRVTVDELFASP